MSLRTTTFGVIIACALVPAAGAQEVIFSRTYVRATSFPVTVTDNFSVCDVAGQFLLVVENGPGGTGRISWGRVKAVTAEALVVERELTADEKRDREAKGLVAADVQDVHVPNAMRNLACTGACTQPQP